MPDFPKAVDGFKRVERRKTKIIRSLGKTFSTFLSLRGDSCMLISQLAAKERRQFSVSVVDRTRYLPYNFYCSRGDKCWALGSPSHAKCGEALNRLLREAGSLL